MTGVQNGISKIGIGYKLLLISLINLFSVSAQKNDFSFRDTLDGQFDLSSFLADANGFVPLPQLITEPALGNFGLALAPVFIKPNKHQSPGEYTPPDITAALAGFTVNNSWLLGAARLAALPRLKLKYSLLTSYASLNLDYYREIANLGERSYSFNFRTVPLFFSLSRQIGQSKLYLGLQYLMIWTRVKPNFEREDIPDFVEDQALHTFQSAPGVFFEYDGRDNIFTPDRGSFLRLVYRLNDEWTGSDFSYQNIDFWLLQYWPIGRYWVSGLKFETQQQIGDAPFYLEPGLNMRGVPTARYQGTSTYLLATEQRYDFNLRWSAIAFSGLAKALSGQQSFGAADWIYNYGGGFRYLMARKFKMRAGVDIALSNQDLGYYLVVGSYW